MPVTYRFSFLIHHFKTSNFVFCDHTYFPENIVIFLMSVFHAFFYTLPFLSVINTTIENLWFQCIILNLINDWYKMILTQNEKKHTTDCWKIAAVDPHNQDCD